MRNYIAITIHELLLTDAMTLDGMKLKDSKKFISEYNLRSI